MPDGGLHLRPDDDKAPARTRALLAEKVPSRAVEMVAVALVWASAAFALLSVLGAVAPAARLPALGLALAGVVCGIAGAIASLGITTLRHLRAEVTGGTAYDQMRGARTLRVASVLLQLLAAAAWVVILVRAATRLGALDVDLETPLVERGVFVLVAAMGAGSALAHLQSLRTPTLLDRSGTTWTFMVIALGAAVLLAAIGAIAAAGQQPTFGALDFEDDDVPLLALTAFAVLAFALRRSRGLPGFASLVADEPSVARGTAVNRTKAVLVPTILAFALLLVVFLLVLLFGIGIGELLTTVERSPILLVSLVFLVVALVASLLLAVFLSRSAERDVPLFAKLPDRKAKQVRWILALSFAVGGPLLVAAFLSYTGTLPKELGLHFTCIGLLILLGPYGFWLAREQDRIRRLEERFPDFLRDIASSHKGGLTLHQSVTIAARGEYGPLTPEVRKMADQLSWNISFHEALERFGERVETPLVQRAVALILQADRSGGSTTDVLLAAARDAREIKNLEIERRITMSLYTIVVYITFFVFLGVAATLYGQFAPAIVRSAEAVGASDLEAGTIGAPSLDLQDYQLFYFTAAIVQAVGDGLVAGLLGTGRAGLGLRHAFVMVASTYLVFALLLL